MHEDTLMSEYSPKNLLHTLGFTHICYLTCDTDWHVYASERRRLSFRPWRERSHCFFYFGDIFIHYLWTERISEKQRPVEPGSLTEG